ncbi:MAG: hypothetical protein AB8F94_11715 [Saprospiraceae bacterium]
MKIALYLLLFILALIGVGFLYIYLKYLRPLRPKEVGTEYVSVEADGTVRELTKDEEDFLQEEFYGADSGRPNIKSNYKKDFDWGHSPGFISRRRVPKHIEIKK